MSTRVWIAPAAAPSGPAWTTYRRMASRTGCPSAPSCSACWSSFRLTGLFLHYSKNEDKRDFFWVAQGGTPSLHRRRGRGAPSTTASCWAHPHTPYLGRSDVDAAAVVDGI